MAHEVVCPKGHRLQITEAHFDKQVRCPTCDEPFMVPNLAGQGAVAANDQPPQVPQIRTAPPSRGRTGAINTSLLVGRPMMAVGLLIVLVSRGCDSIGQRGANRAGARQVAAVNEFQQRWDRKLEEYGGVRSGRSVRDLEEMRRSVRGPGFEDDELRAQASERKPELDLRKEMSEERKGLAKGEWRDLENAAANAKTSNTINRFWFAIVFLLGTIILTFGLLILSWNAQGAERSVCLIMLAIVTFSIYVVGVGWIPLPAIPA